MGVQQLAFPPRAERLLGGDHRLVDVRLAIAADRPGLVEYCLIKQRREAVDPGGIDQRVALCGRVRRSRVGESRRGVVEPLVAVRVRSLRAVEEQRKHALVIAAKVQLERQVASARDVPNQAGAWIDRPRREDVKAWPAHGVARGCQPRAPLAISSAQREGEVRGHGEVILREQRVVFSVAMDVAVAAPVAARRYPRRGVGGIETGGTAGVRTPGQAAVPRAIVPPSRALDFSSNDDVVVSGECMPPGTPRKCAGDARRPHPLIEGGVLIGRLTSCLE